MICRRQRVSADRLLNLTSARRVPLFRHLRVERVLRWCVRFARPPRFLTRPVGGQSGHPPQWTSRRVPCQATSQSFRRALEWRYGAIIAAGPPQVGTGTPTMRAVFLSYSRASEALVNGLAKDIKALGHSLWFDQELSGGQAWWDQILSRVSECDVFVFALTPQSLTSVACNREHDYAAALGKSILPVLLSDLISGSVLRPALAQIHRVDFRTRDPEAILRLSKALNGLPPAGPLPDPLPGPPDVPISYLGGLAELLSMPSLSKQEQATLLHDLKRGLRDDETRIECLAQLVRMRKRHDLLATIAEDIDETIVSHRVHVHTSVHSKPQPQVEALPPPQIETLAYVDRQLIVLADRSRTARSVFGHVIKLGGKLSPIRLVARDEVARLSFTVGHPRNNVIYVGHPLVPSKYYPAAEFHRCLFEEKFAEFFGLLRSLGATHIKIDPIEGPATGRDLAAKMDALGHAIGRDAADIRDTSSPMAIEAYYDTIAASPKCPENMVWYSHEPVWRDLAESRLKSDLRRFSLKIVHKDDFGINANLARSLERLDLKFDLGGTFDDFQKTIWHVSGAFGELRRC